MPENSFFFLRMQLNNVFSECVALQDPYCAWDKLQGKCRSHGVLRWNEENFFYQSVATGQHAACPPNKLSSKDAGNFGGFSLPKDSMQPSKDQPEGQIISILQDKEYENSGRCWVQSII